MMTLWEKSGQIEPLKRGNDYPRACNTALVGRGKCGPVPPLPGGGRGGRNGLAIQNQNPGCQSRDTQNCLPHGDCRRLSKPLSMGKRCGSWSNTLLIPALSVISLSK